MARLGKHDSNSCTTVVVLLVPVQVPVTELVSASVATGAVEAVVGGTVCEGVAVREKEVPGDVTGPPATVDTVDTAGESAGVGVGTAVEAVEDEPKEKPEVAVGAAAVPAVPVEGAAGAAAKVTPAM